MSSKVTKVARFIKFSMLLKPEQAPSHSQTTMDTEFLFSLRYVVVYHAESSGMICQSC